jgi:hypothetical protein
VVKLADSVQVVVTLADLVLGACGLCFFFRAFFVSVSTRDFVANYVYSSLIRVVEHKFIQP